jgi:predicted enzyme related to lactoylglutathione lyase
MSASSASINDPARSTAFYRDVFGWQPETFDDAPGEVTLWRLPGYVGGEPQQPVPVPPHWSIDFWVADADRAALFTISELLMGK